MTPSLRESTFLAILGWIDVDTVVSCMGTIEGDGRDIWAKKKKLR